MEKLSGNMGSLGTGETVGHVSTHVSDAVWVRITSVSMAPYLKLGMAVQVQRYTPTLRDVPEDRIYVYRYEGIIQLKKLQQMPGHRIRIISTDTEFQSIDIEIDDGPDFEVLGRVLI